MSCIYNYYKEEETYYPRLYCKVNDKYCIYSKKCLKQEKFIPIDSQDGRECYLFNMEKKKNIPNGSNYVAFEHKGYLFIEVGDKTIKVKNTLEEKVENYVYLKKVGDDYEISLSPFPTKVKKTNKVEEGEVVEQPKPRKKKKKPTEDVKVED